jgi:hypothetical protein
MLRAAGMAGSAGVVPASAPMPASSGSMLSEPAGVVAAASTCGSGCLPASASDASTPAFGRPTQDLQAQRPLNSHARSGFSSLNTKVEAEVQAGGASQRGGKGSGEGGSDFSGLERSGEAATGGVGVVPSPTPSVAGMAGSAGVVPAPAPLAGGSTGGIGVVPMRASSGSMLSEPAGVVAAASTCGSGCLPASASDASAPASALPGPPYVGHVQGAAAMKGSSKGSAGRSISSAAPHPGCPPGVPEDGSSPCASAGVVVSTGGARSNSVVGPSAPI